MGRKSKYSKEQKISIVKRYLNGDGSLKSLAKEANTATEVVRRWVKKYQSSGENAFDISSKTNSSYTKEFKEQIVSDYLNGGGSYVDMMIKYNIPGESTVLKWVNDYNSHKENEVVYSTTSSNNIFNYFICLLDRGGS